MQVVTRKEGEEPVVAKKNGTGERHQYEKDPGSEDFGCAGLVFRFQGGDVLGHS